MPARNSVDLETYLRIVLQARRMSPEEVSRQAGFREPDFVERVLKGEAQLPLDRAAAVARVTGKDPAFLMQLALVANHPEIWAVLRDQPDCLLGRNERVWMRLYWRVSANARTKLTLRHRRQILEALDVDPDAYLREGDDQDG